MRIAQQLYEGVQLHGGELVGLITYMRTDSVRIADEAIVSVREHIESTLGKSYLPKQPRYFKKKKGAQDAHEAVRPTNVEITPDSIKGDLSEDQYKLYDLTQPPIVEDAKRRAHADATLSPASPSSVTLVSRAVTRGSAASPAPRSTRR